MREEIDLINSAVQNSDPEAWQQIYNRCYYAVVQTVARYGSAGQAVEDLTQKTFIKIYNSKTKPFFKDVRAFYAWLIKVIRSVVYDQAKSRFNSNEKLTEYVEDIDALVVDDPQVTAPDDTIEIKVRNALAKLSEKEQKLVVMRANNTPYSKIVLETGIPIDNIRMYYKRAAKKLKEYLVAEGITQ